MGNKKFQEKDFIDISQCNLCPTDLFIFAELYGIMAIKKVKSVNLSENLEMIDRKFVRNMVRIIKYLRCNEILLKNSVCEQKYVNNIKSVLGDEYYFLNFIIS